MPFRWQETFGSQPADVGMRSARTVAALVLVMAGWSVGFLSGRMSAWLVPVETAGVAVEKKGPSRGFDVATTTTLRPANSSSKIAAAELPAPAPEAINDGKSPRQEQTLPPNTATSEDGSATTPALERTGQPKDTENWVTVETKADARALTLLNPASKRARRDADPSRSPPRDLDQAGMEECERRYSSFRRSDGTYQPYGRSSREPCPFLR
jgi:hypothetical protein